MSTGYCNSCRLEGIFSGKEEKFFSSLHHPLLLLIVGALISGYTIPLYTQSWQDQQKDLELKTDLVSEISDAVATILIKTQTKKVITSIPYTEFYNAYQDWKSSSAILESKLRAYFFDSSLPVTKSKFLLTRYGSSTD